MPQLLSKIKEIFIVKQTNDLIDFFELSVRKKRDFCTMRYVKLTFFKGIFLQDLMKSPMQNI